MLSFICDNFVQLCSPSPVSCRAGGKGRKRREFSQPRVLRSTRAHRPIQISKVVMMCVCIKDEEMKVRAS